MRVFVTIILTFVLYSASTITDGKSILSINNLNQNDRKKSPQNVRDQTGSITPFISIKGRGKIEVQREFFNLNKHFNFIYEKFLRSSTLKLPELILKTTILDFLVMLVLDLSHLSQIKLSTIDKASKAIISDHELYSLVQSIAAKSGINHEIDVYILPDDNIPGMTVGFTRLNHIIAISKRIRKEAPIEVLQSIIAHECGHIKRLHLVINVVCNNFLYMGFSKVFDVIYTKLVTKFEKNRRNKVVNGLVAFLSLTAKCTVIFSLVTIGNLISMKISRIHEYSADRHAAELYGSNAMIRCLEYIERDQLYLSICQHIKSWFGIKIMNQITKKKFQLNFLNHELFSTHPTHSNRIKRLKELNLIGKYSPAIRKKKYFFI